MTICRLVLAISNTCRFGALVSLSAFHFQGVKEFCTEDDRKIEESVSDVHRRPREIGRPSVPLVVAEGVCLPPGCQRKIQKERRPGRFAGLPLADEEGDVARAEIAAREPGRVVKSCLSRLGRRPYGRKCPLSTACRMGKRLWGRMTECRWGSLEVSSSLQSLRSLHAMRALRALRTMHAMQRGRVACNDATTSTAVSGPVSKSHRLLIRSAR